jgi:endogenous inhibitor of DNA gyrase (YacG/DUF329 family)
MSAPRPEDETRVSEAEAASVKARKCAVCGKPQDAKFKPFCSKRCADVDLSRWLKGNYTIPAEEPPEFGEEG